MTGDDALKTLSLDWLQKQSERLRDRHDPEKLWRRLGGPLRKVLMRLGTAPARLRAADLEALEHRLSGKLMVRHPATFIRGLLERLEREGLCVLPSRKHLVKAEAFPPPVETLLAYNICFDLKETLIRALARLPNLSEADRLMLGLLWIMTVDRLLDAAAVGRLLNTRLGHSLKRRGTRLAVCVPANPKKIRRGARLLPLNPVSHCILEPFEERRETWLEVIAPGLANSRSPSKVVWPHLRRFLLGLGCRLDTIPTSLRDYLRQVRLAGILTTSPVLLAYAAGDLQSFSRELDEPALTRAREPQSHSDTQDVTESHELDADPETWARLDDALAEARALAVAVHAGRFEAAHDCLKAQGYLADAPFALSLARFLVDGERHASHGIALDDLERLLQNAVTDFATDDPSRLNEYDFGDAYSNWLTECTSTRARELMSRILSKFHRAQAGYARIHFREVEGFEGARIAVDAQLVTEAQYDRALQQLSEAADPEAAGARLTLILLFRLGLRPSELLRMTLRQIETALRLFVTVRGKVKTPRARRVLPAEELLTPLEARLLIDYVARRRGEGGNLLTPLLPSDGRTDNTHYVRRVLEELRAVTHNPTLRVYQLRHCFATRLFLEKFRALFTASDTEVQELLGPPLPADGWLQGVLKDQRWLPQVSRLMGHGSSDITLLHYIHALDYVLMAHVRRDGIRLPIEAVMGLLDVGRTAAYEKLKGRMHDGTVDGYALEALLL